VYLDQLAAFLLQVGAHDGAQEVQAAIDAPEQGVHAGQVLVPVANQQRHQPAVLHLHQRRHLRSS